MRKRNIRYQLWMNEKEAERFNKLVERSGLPREVYLRQLINGLVPTDAPPPDYFAMMKELHYIGVNLNQISKKSNYYTVRGTGERKVIYGYNCGTYTRMGKTACTTHYISENDLKELVIADIRQKAGIIIQDENAAILVCGSFKLSRSNRNLSDTSFMLTSQNRISPL